MAGWQVSTRRSGRSLAQGLILSGTLLVCSLGCRSGPTATVSSVPPPPVPPLFASAVSPSPLDASTASVAASPEMVPPMPVVDRAPIAPVLSAQEMAPRQPASPQPVAPQSAPQPFQSSQIVQTQGTSNWTPTANCLPTEAEWKETLEQQSAALQSRLRKFEEELETARQEMRSVNSELQASQGQIGRLNQDLAHWKGETQRLENEIRSQQQSDLKSLDELTGAVTNLIETQRTGPAPGGSP